MIGGQLDVAGTYTLTSTTANAPSHAPAGDRFTAFTSALLRALDEADPLTLDQIYVVVDSDLAARNLPRPQRRVVNAAGNLALYRGPTPVAPTEQPDSDTVRFGHIPQLVTIGWQKMLLAPILGIMLLFVVLTISLDSSELEIVGIIFFCAFLALPIPFAMIVYKWTEWAGSCYELVVDRSGLTVRWKRTRNHSLGRTSHKSACCNPGVMTTRPTLSWYGRDQRFRPPVLVVCCPANTDSSVMSACAH